MRRDVTRDQVTEYVRQRLRQECAQRGQRAEIARRTGFTPQHLSLVVRGKVGAGDVFVRALLDYWNISREELERLADPKGREEPYPNRTKALALAAEMPWPPETYKEVLALTPAVDPPIGWWLVQCYLSHQKRVPYEPVPAPQTRRRSA